MLYPLLVLVLLIVVALLVMRARRRRGAAKPMYQRRGNLLSEAEWSFFLVLRRAVGDRGLVMAKVRIADVLTPAPQRDRRQWWRLFNRIAAKHWDYLICSPLDSRPLLAVELDDRSHRQRRGRERDDMVNRAAADAGLPLVRFPARTGYALQQVREQLGEYLPVAPEDAEGAADGEAVTGPSPAAPGDHPAEDLIRAATGTDDNPACRRCGHAMVRREARQADGAARPFWVCGRYPACRGARPAY